VHFGVTVRLSQRCVRRIIETSGSSSSCRWHIVEKDVQIAVLKAPRGIGHMQTIIRKEGSRTLPCLAPTRALTCSSAVAGS
jgi:hypothetical protein